MVGYQPSDWSGYHQALLNRIKMIEDLGTNQTQLTNELVARRNAARDRFRLLPNVNPGDYSPSLLGRAQPGGSFGSFLRSIAAQESGGNYGAVNRSSGAMGKYQIMPGNLVGLRRGWDYEALGRDVSNAEFLRSPQIQEAIAQFKLRSYYQKWGPAGAAVAWYAGPGAVGRKLHRSRGYTGGYPSINAYMQQVLGRM